MGRKYLRNAKMWRRGEFCFHKFCHQLFRGCIATRLLCASSSVSSIKYPKHPSTCGLELSSNCKYSQQRHPIAIPQKHQFLILDKQEHKVSYRCSLPSPLQKRSKDYKGLGGSASFELLGFLRLWQEVSQKSEKLLQSQRKLRSAKLAEVLCNPL